MSTIFFYKFTKLIIFIIKFWITIQYTSKNFKNFNKIKFLIRYCWLLFNFTQSYFVIYNNSSNWSTSYNNLNYILKIYEKKLKEWLRITSLTRLNDYSNWKRKQSDRDSSMNSGSKNSRHLSDMDVGIP